jgi:hypothetical protein
MRAAASSSRFIWTSIILFRKNSGLARAMDDVWLNRKMVKMFDSRKRKGPDIEEELPPKI